MTVTLITGGNKGLGFETARRLRDVGHTVYVGARDHARGQAAANELGVQFLLLDVTDDESVSAAGKEFERRQGVLDVLVNNAGIAGPRKHAGEYTATDAAEVLLTNVVGNVRVTHTFLPMLQRSENPVIVNVGSGNGSFGLFHDDERIESTTGMPLYGASKAAINMLTVRYAKLLPAIKINVADPGQTATDLTRGSGHSLHEGTDAIVALACIGPDGPSGTYRDRDGRLPW